LRLLISLQPKHTVSQAVKRNYEQHAVLDDKELCWRFEPDWCVECLAAVLLRGCRRSFEGDVGSCEVEVPPAKAWWCRSSFEGDVGSGEVEVPPAKARWRGAFLNPEFTQYYPCAPNHLKRFKKYET
jgi:hypothetical protein